ncbi:MAG: response regulator transcription factor [Treponema sp.]|jgi:DNA-binding NarL/FixJ family response regulator|nr:response regulator transcription factor [Treponema sp.]
MIRIAIIEDQVMFQDSLARFLGEQADMEVAGVSVDAAGASGLCRKCSPDLVLMDVITGSDSNGITAAAQIRKDFPEIKIVVMTALPEITFIDAAKKAGVHSFIYKNADSQHLLYVIRSTMKGQGVYPGPADSSMLSGEAFTDAEIALIRLVCRGMSRAEIAGALALSEGTVKSLITGILDKTGFDSIMKFAVYAVSNGFIVPEI